MSESECDQCGMTGQCKMDCTEEPLSESKVMSESEDYKRGYRLGFQRGEGTGLHHGHSNGVRVEKERVEAAIAWLENDLYNADCSAGHALGCMRKKLAQLPPRARSESGQSGGEYCCTACNNGTGALCVTARLKLVQKAWDEFEKGHSDRTRPSPSFELIHGLRSILGPRPKPEGTRFDELTQQAGALDTSVLATCSQPALNQPNRSLAMSKPTEGQIAVAYVLDRAESYSLDNGYRIELEDLADALKRGEHMARYKHGEVDDLLRRWGCDAEPTEPEGTI